MKYYVEVLDILDYGVRYRHLGSANNTIMVRSKNGFFKNFKVSGSTDWVHCNIFEIEDLKIIYESK